MRWYGIILVIVVLMVVYTVTENPYRAATGNQEAPAVPQSSEDASFKNLKIN